MQRIRIDGTTQWFDGDKAICFEEDVWFNGHNHISVPTGSQWDHEQLLYTANGNWVLYSWSQYQHVRATYRLLEQDDAIAWLIQNNQTDESFEKLPKTVRHAIDEAIGNAEV